MFCFFKKISEGKRKFFAQCRCHCRFQWRCWYRYTDAGIIGQLSVIHYRYYCYNYESVTVRSDNCLMIDLFIQDWKNWIFYFCEILKVGISKKHSCSILVLNSKPMRERVYCLTFIQSFNNWGRECKYSRNIAIFYMRWGLL